MEEEGSKADDLETNQPILDGMETRVFRMTLPMPSKNLSETIKAAMEMLMRLKVDGFEVQRLHTDRGKEFRQRTLSELGDEPWPHGVSHGGRRPESDW